MKKSFLSLSVALFALFAMSETATAQNPYDQYYVDLPCVVEHVQPVVFPDYTVSILNFGGVGDGVTDNTEAFAKAMKHLKNQGGGHLLVPEGKWLTGPIKLVSNVDLHLAANAVILGSTNKELYVQKNDSLRDGSKKCHALIYGSKLENVGITGRGTIDGQGIYWRPIKQKKVVDPEVVAADGNVWDEVLAMGGVTRPDGNSKKWLVWYPFSLNKDLNIPNIAKDPITQEKMRPHLVNITDSKNVIIRNVHLLNSPKFHLVPTRVQNLIIDGVTIRCPHWAQNGDAMDPGNIQVAVSV